MANLVEVTGNILLFALVFGMSATVDFHSIRGQLGNTRAILCGMFLQFFVLPLLGFCAVNILNLDKATGITLLVLTSSPGGSYSNWWCSVFNADLALSVTMTAASTFLSTVFLPLNLLLYAQWAYDDDIIGNLDWKSLFTAIAIVLTAIVLGLFCSAKIHSHRFNIGANKIGNIAGIALIILSAFMTNTGSADTKIWSRSWQFYLGVAFPCLLGLLISNVLCSFLNLKKPERVTVSVESCYQNVGIASSIGEYYMLELRDYDVMWSLTFTYMRLIFLSALTMFEGDELSEAMGVPFFYGICEMSFLAVYCVCAWKGGWTKAPSDAPFWKVISTNYEVLLAEQKELEAIEISVHGNNDKADELSQSGDIVSKYISMGDVALVKKESSGEPKEEIPTAC